MEVSGRCLSDDDLVALLDGTASARIAAIEAHLDGCPRCREVVAAMATAGPIATGSRPGTGATLAVGEVVADRYRIVRFVARGGMGEVYQAADLALGEDVALKTVNAALSDDPTLVERLKREVQLARRVSHPNVCRTFDWVIHHRASGDVALLSMELLAGQTLDARLRTGGKLPAAQALSMLQQIAAGLDAAHAVGVIHRDLKPANVFLVPAVAGTRAVITDFGLARAEATDELHGVALTRGPLGTPTFMAPEQERGEAVSAAVDVYSFGRVMQEVLAAPDARWQGAIARCLADDPAARPTSAGAVMRGLVEPRRGWRWAALGAVPVAAIAAFAFTRPGASRDRAAAGPPPCAPRAADDDVVEVSATDGRVDSAGTAACPVRTITLALAIAAKRAAPTRIRVAAGTYDAALGERFPLEVRGPIAITGAGPDATRIVGTGPQVFDGTSVADGTLQTTIVIGDVAATTEVSALSVSPADPSGTLGTHGIICDRGNVTSYEGELPPPSTILRDVAVGPGYWTGVVAGGLRDLHACHLRGERLLVRDVKVGVWAVGCGQVTNQAEQVPVALELVDSRALGVRSPIEPGGQAVSIWDCVRAVTLRGNVISNSDRGISIVNHAEPLTRVVIEKNVLGDLRTLGLELSIAARVDRLVGNRFVHISAGPAATNGHRAVALVLDSSNHRGLGSPQIMLARQNVFFENDVAIEARGTAPYSGVVDFGRPDDPGENVISCSATVDGSAVPGHDLIVRAPLAPRTRLAFAGNTWNHAPPTRGPANGADLDVPARAALDVTGARVSQGCNSRVP